MHVQEQSRNLRKLEASVERIELDGTKIEVGAVLERSLSERCTEALLRGREIAFIRTSNKFSFPFEE